jgi:hypothetical protein
METQTKVTNTPATETEVGLNSNAIVKASSNNTIVVNASHDDIAIQWFQERRRQAKASFNATISLWTLTAAFSIGVAVSVCMGNMPAAVATTAVGLTTGAATTRLFKLSDDANKKLDATAKELLDDE